MNFQFLLIVIVLIIILMLYKDTNKDNKELFDARVSNINKNECGKMCTDTYDCKSFAYDSNAKKCYLSKTPIIALPSGTSIYVDEYKADQLRCNKIKPIELDQVNQDPEIMRDNEIYTCADRQSGNYKLYKIVNGIMEEIPKREDIGKVSLEPYVMRQIEWPSAEFKKDLEPDLKLIKPRPNYVLFQKDKREFLGQTLFPYQCVSGVGEEDCINQCRRYDDCIGTEWNPIIEGDKISDKVSRNVCCPKKKITEIIDRRDQFSNGFFYLKKNTNLLDPNDMYMIYSKNK